MNNTKLINIESHFSTPNNIVCIGESINYDYFLLVITIRDKAFPRRVYDAQDESVAITKYRNKHYKIEVTLFPKKFVQDYKRSVYNTLKHCYKKVYNVHKKNEHIIKITDDNEFDYTVYNIPRNVWLISIGYIVGTV